MMRVTFAGVAAALLLVLAVADTVWRREGTVVAATASLSTTTSPADAAADFLYARVTTIDGTAYQGQLRFGGDEEAFWDHYFNGVKDENSWARLVPRERLPKVRDSIDIFGIEITAWESPIDLRRPFMARFGDIARIEAHGRALRVMLKSGTVFHLDRFAADDFADGVRVWDERRGIVDLNEWRIRVIEFLPAPRLSHTSNRLHGTVRTRSGDFTGFIQWDREKSVGADNLVDRTADAGLNLRFDTIRSIARRSRDSSLVALADGREITLSNTRAVGRDNRGLYVDDGRYGRVLVSWDAFERVDFSPGGTTPAYSDFPPGRALTGSVITRSGHRLAGRLVYDLDESENTETLDAPWQGVDYTIPFARIASIVRRLDERGAQRARVILHSGEELRLEAAGDLGEGNGGMLIFAAGSERAEYVPWSDVAQIEFERTPDANATKGRR